MEDDVPYDDQFDEVVSSSDDDEDEEEGKVCCPGRSCQIEKEWTNILSSQLDIEKQSKKIREKQRQSKERSDQELLTNIQQQETIQFPSGQEVTKDGTQDLSSSPDDHQSFFQLHKLIYNCWCIVFVKWSMCWMISRINVKPIGKWTRREIRRETCSVL